MRTKSEEGSFGRGGWAGSGLISLCANHVQPCLGVRKEMRKGYCDEGMDEERTNCLLPSSASRYIEISKIPSKD